MGVWIGKISIEKQFQILVGILLCANIVLVNSQSTPLNCALYTSNLSQPRANLAATSVPDTLSCFAGGYNYSAVSTRVDIYNHVFRTWSTTELSQPRQNLAAATIGSLALFAGGHGVSTVSVVDTVEIYNTSSNSWMAPTTLFQARAEIASVTCNSKVFFIGGRDNAAMASDVIDIYDGNTGLWSLKFLPTPSYGAVATCIEDELVYVAGGTWYSVKETVFIYNVTSDSWSSLNLTTARYNHAGASCNNISLFIGGIDSNLQQISTMELFNTSGYHYLLTGHASYGLGAATVKDLVLAAGGFNTSGALITLDVFNMTSGTFYSQKHLSVARGYLGSTAVTNIAMFGGGDAGGVVVDNVDIFDCTGYAPSPSPTPTPTQTPTLYPSSSATPYPSYYYPSVSPQPNSTISTSASPSPYPDAGFTTSTRSSEDPSGSGSSTKMAAMIGGIVGGAALLSAAIVCGVFVVMKRKKNDNSNEADIEMNKDQKNAKKDKKKDSKKGEEKEANPFFTELERKDFLPVGIPEIDDLFSKVQAPLDTLCELSDAISEASEAINSLDQQAQEVSQATFKQKLQMLLQEVSKCAGARITATVNDTQIAITLVGATNSRVIQAVESLNTLVQSAITVITKTPEIIQQLVELGQTAAEFPPKVKDMAASAGLGFMQIPKAVKNLSLNIKYLAAAPNDVKAFLESVQELISTLKEVLSIGESTEPQSTQGLPAPEETSNNNNNQSQGSAAEVAPSRSSEAPQIQDKAQPKKQIKIGIKRMNKRGGAEIILPDTLEQLLVQGGEILKITAVKARRTDNEFLISDISLIEPNQVIYLTDANDEALFE